MNKQQMKSWETIKSKGLLRYVLVDGVVSYGLFMFIVMAFVNKLFSDGLTSKAAISHCIIWPLSGIGFGLLNWFVNERLYRKSKSVSKNI